MLDFIKNAVNTLAGPMATAADFAGDKLGLPPLLTNSIKAVAGAVTGNVMLAASGAMGVVSELQKNPAAQTEFYPCSDMMRAQQGYASPAQTSSAAASSTGTLEPSVLEYREALKTIAANYGLLDTLCGKQNGKFDIATLQAASHHPNLSPELRSAAHFLLGHPEYRNMVDTAGEGGRVDGTISQKDVQKALKKVNDDIAQYGVRQPSTPAPSVPAPAPAPSTPPAGTCPPPAGTCPPPAGTCPPPGQPSTPVQGTPVPTPPPSTGGSGSGVSDIINNPNMSMEEKLQAILMMITRDTDEEILGVMQEMANVRGERASLGTGQTDPSRAAKLETSMEQLNLRLQKLMEKRKQMFDLMSTISSKFNEMAKVAIQNLGRA
ncbi:hypothetical protein [Hyalangium rubrum]|uniref:Uncharacterized protein n=1 Tax=Hyalangium rubrum TaxID=3103134 RepID=A0ABU5H6M6_9BACT|nr:hypothetical protein [Hyalangium sp. s54d21]MDY7228417.1 hypothetical protein [Hyalangium sp. s54d21]